MVETASFYFLTISNVPALAPGRARDVGEWPLVLQDRLTRRALKVVSNDQSWVDREIAGCEFRDGFTRDFADFFERHRAETSGGLIKGALG